MSLPTAGPDPLPGQSSLGAPLQDVGPCLAPGAEGLTSVWRVPVRGHCSEKLLSCLDVYHVSWGPGTAVGGHAPVLRAVVVQWGEER